MPRLSIIVPHQGDSGPFEDSLVSVLQNRPRDCEVIVPHAVDYRDPYGLDDEVTFVAVAGRPSLVALLNAALEQAAGDVLFVLQSGVEAQEGWSEAALTHFDRAEVGCVAPWVVEKGNDERLVATGVGYGAGGKRRLIGTGAKRRAAARQAGQVLGPSLYAGFYRTSALQSLGGFDPAVGDELADVDVALALQSVGYRCATEPESRADCSIPTQGKRWSIDSGRQAERLYGRYAADYGTPARVAHAVRLSGEAVCGLACPLQLAAHWTGRMLALFEFSGRRQFREHLESQPRPGAESRDDTGAILPMRPLPAVGGADSRARYAA